MFIWVAMVLCDNRWQTPHELEMSSGWGIDYGKDDLATSSRQELELNVMIQGRKIPLQGALGLNESHGFIMPQMGC